MIKNFLPKVPVLTVRWLLRTLDQGFITLGRAIVWVIQTFDNGLLTFGEKLSGLESSLNE